MLTFANFRMPMNDAGTTEIYSFGGYGHRDGTGNAFRRYVEQRAQLAGDLPARLPADVQRPRRPTTRRPAGSAGVVSGWNYDAGRGVRAQRLRLRHDDDEQRVAGTLPRRPLRPGPDRILGTADDPGIPNQTEFFSGRLLREELIAARQRGPAGGARTARAAQPRLRRRVPPGELRDPRGRAGLLGQRLPPRTRTAPDRSAPRGLVGLPRLHAGRRDRAGPEQLRALRRRRDRPHAQAAGERRRAVRVLQRLRRAGLAARWRSATSPRGGSVPRGARARASGRPG